MDDHTSKGDANEDCSELGQSSLEKHSRCKVLEQHQKAPLVHGVFTSTPAAFSALMSDGSASDETLLTRSPCFSSSAGSACTVFFCAGFGLNVTFNISVAVPSRA